MTPDPDRCSPAARCPPPAAQNQPTPAPPYYRMTELELKFCVPDAALASLREALRAHGAKRVRLRAHYFDTACGTLARHRIALRLRLEGRRWVQTLKAAGDGAVHRLEHEVRVPGSSHERPALNPARHDGTAAGEQLAGALREAADPRLIEQHATDIQRLHCDLHDADGTQVEAALDVGLALAEGRTTPIVELELEHKGGPLAGLFTLAQACVQHGGLWQSTLTKAERGLRLRDGADAPRAAMARPPRLAPGADGATLMRALLQSALEQVLDNASELQPGADVVEVVHQLRVGLRRLRVLLRELAPLLQAPDAGWAPVLSAAFARLGEQRDHVAVVAAVRPLLQAAGAPRLEWRPPASAADPVQVAREPALQTTLLALQALAHADDAAFAALPPKATRALVAARLRKLHRQVLRAADTFEQLPPDGQHRVRKQLKRLRYLADFSGALWPARPRQGCRRAMQRAQDALGLHHDVMLAAAGFRAEAGRVREAGFAAGWLHAHQAVTAQAAGRELRRLAEVKVFWR
ncbi:MAG: inorganic triphosphatase [Leptothrix sp. (in: Bacteria)]|nr:inorganic triphosphatase [Leptothrix sp. (in: b-proteobacteria)]